MSLAKKTAYETWLETPRYQLPHEAAALRRDWWTTTQAALAWGVSPRTARRYFEQIGETLVMARNVRTSRVRILHCVPANTLRPPVRRGNPRFTEAEYQKANSAKRWDGHITRAQREEWQRQYDDAALLDLAEEAANYLAPDEETDEDWEPYPLPEYQEPQSEEQYAEQWLRDAMARKRARQPKASR